MQINWNFKESLFLKFEIGQFDFVVNHILKKVGHSNIVLPLSLNDCAEAWKSQSLANFYSQVDICTTDGMPLVWFFKFCTKTKVERVYGPDLMSHLLKNSNKKISHYFLGSSLTSNQKLRQYLGQNFAHLNIKGFSFLEKDSQEKIREKQLIKEIKLAQPQVLWLGLGSPKQVKLAAIWKKHLPETTIICVGAAFNLLTRYQPKAPVFLQKIGLEWLFRLLVEPKRLWRRYLVTIPQFILGYFVDNFGEWCQKVTFTE